jgi:hypothetical protein
VICIGSPAADDVVIATELLDLADLFLRGVEQLVRLVMNERHGVEHAPDDLVADFVVGTRGHRPRQPTTAPCSRASRSISAPNQDVVRSARSTSPDG